MIRTPLLPLLTLLLLSGCATTPTTEPAADEDAAAPPLLIEYDGDTLANLLVAEVAAQRQAFDITLAHYQHAAFRTGDPKVIRQATQLAYYLEDYPATLALSEYWLSRVPGEEEALRLAALAQIQQGNIDGAARQLDQLIGQYGPEGLARMVGHASNLEPEKSLTLVATLAQLSERYPQQAPLWYARALHLQQQKEYSAALDANRQAMALMPEHEESQLLHGQLLHQLGDSKQALRHLKRLVRKNPDSRRPRISYIRLLLENDALAQAETQLGELAKRFPDDLDLQFSLALLALEAGANDSAEARLQQLLEQGYRSNEIHLYLAQSAEQRNDPEQAVSHFLQVKGAQQVRAQVQAARLLYQLEKPNDAHAIMQRLISQHPDLRDSLLLSEVDMRVATDNPQGAISLLSHALDEDPDNVTLLYSRALTAESLNNLALMEKDLRHILALKPDDPSALNALGYTLADRGLRLPQAQGYIERALAQRPDDPAILDSMGWVLFRQGRAEQALPYLQKAHDTHPDPEIAAHLGEVLWALGNREQAAALLRESFRANPQSHLLSETMERLGVRP